MPPSVPTWSRSPQAFDQSTGEGVVCDWEYRIVTATKR